MKKPKFREDKTCPRPWGSKTCRQNLALGYRIRDPMTGGEQPRRPDWILSCDWCGKCADPAEPLTMTLLRGSLQRWWGEGHVNCLKLRNKPCCRSPTVTVFQGTALLCKGCRVGWCTGEREQIFQAISTVHLKGLWSKERIKGPSEYNYKESIPYHPMNIN